MANRPRRGNKRSRRSEEDDDVYMGQVEDDDGYAPRRRSQRKRRKKNKHYEGDGDQIYKDGDIVWARLEDFPWWPARCEIEGEDQGYPFHVRVRWFGEDNNQAHLLPRDRIVPFDSNLRSRLEQDTKVEPEDKEEFDMCVAEAEIELQQRLGPRLQQTVTAAPASLRAIMPQSSPHSLKSSSTPGGRTSQKSSLAGSSSASSRNGEMTFGGAGLSMNDLASAAANVSAGALTFDDDKEDDGGIVLPEPTVRDWTYMSYAEKKQEEKEALQLQQQQEQQRQAQLAMQQHAQQQQQHSSYNVHHSVSVEQPVEVTYLRCPSPDVLESLMFITTPDQIPMSWLGQERAFGTRSGYFSQHSYLTEIASKSQPIQGAALGMDPKHVQPNQPSNEYNGRHQPHAAIPVIHGENNAPNGSGVDTLQHVAASVISNSQLQQEEEIVLPDPSDLAAITGLHTSEAEFSQIERQVEQDLLGDQLGSRFDAHSHEGTGDVELPEIHLGFEIGDSGADTDTNFSTAVEPLPEMLQ